MFEAFQIFPNIKRLVLEVGGFQLLGAGITIPKVPTPLNCHVSQREREP